MSRYALPGVRNTVTRLLDDFPRCRVLSSECPGTRSQGSEQHSKVSRYIVMMSRNAVMMSRYTLPGWWYDVPRVRVQIQFWAANFVNLPGTAFQVRVQNHFWVEMPGFEGRDSRKNERATPMIAERRTDEILRRRQTSFLLFHRLREKSEHGHREQKRRD